MKTAWSALACAALAIGASADAASTHRARFGTLSDGTVMEAVTLTGADGVSARIITYGATLQAFNVPDRAGRVADAHSVVNAREDTSVQGRLF